MPAPAVIPAPIAYIKVVAVKKLVVGFWGNGGGSGLEGCQNLFFSFLLSCEKIGLPHSFWGVYCFLFPSCGFGLYCP